MGSPKNDLRLFTTRIAEWQENYMAKLINEYIDLLKGPEKASEKFWTLDRKIKQDRKHPGVIIKLNQRDIIYDIVSLINLGVITLDDLEDFSDDLKEKVDFLLSSQERFKHDV